MSTLDIDAYIVRMFDQYGSRYEYRITGMLFAEEAAREALDMFLSDDDYSEMLEDGDEKIIAVCREKTGFTAEDTEWFKICAASTIVHNTDYTFDIECDMDIDPHKWMNEDKKQ